MAADVDKKRGVAVVVRLSPNFVAVAWRQEC